MSTDLKPMLATDADLDAIPFPVYASPKLDGIRCLIRGGKAVSRSLKLIPNHHTQSLFGREFLGGLDGELCVGPPNAKDLMQRTSSGVMKHAGEPDVTFHVFDFWLWKITYQERLDLLLKYRSVLEAEGQHIKVVEQTLIESNECLLKYETAMLAEGYEGVMLRKPDSPYKFGRSTVKEGYLLKVKRFVDGEAVVLGLEELLHNDNELEADNLGYAKRATKQENMIPGNTLGALKVRDAVTGIEFSIGTGFTAEARKLLWEQGASLVGKLVKYKHFAVTGVKDKPRIPVFLGFRDPSDL